MPGMVGKVASYADKDDSKYRMLCEAMAEVRAVNEIARVSEQDRFVVMAVYVTEQLVAERYLLYLPREHDRHVSSHLLVQSRS